METKFRVGRTTIGVLDVIKENAQHHGAHLDEVHAIIRVYIHGYQFVDYTSMKVVLYILDETRVNFEKIDKYSISRIADGRFDRGVIQGIFDRLGKEFFEIYIHDGEIILQIP